MNIESNIIPESNKINKIPEIDEKEFVQKVIEEIYKKYGYSGPIQRSKI